MKRIILALFLNAILAFFIPLKSYATHLMGGSMTYEYMGMVGADQSYLVTLKIYRYCDASAGGTAPLDASMFLGIYNQDVLNPNADKNGSELKIFHWSAVVLLHLPDGSIVPSTLSV
jgi:hypothetical protein